MSKLYLRLAIILGLLCSALPASAVEKILKFHSDIVVSADGSLEVTETIQVRAEGQRIRRGIYRDFPTRYKNSLGGEVVVSFTPLDLLRDGNQEPWFTEHLPNGVRVNFGDDRFLPTPLETTYTFRYRTDRQLGFFKEHDELYWNVTGNGWKFAIDRASARVQLPQPIPRDQLRLDHYTGPQGSRGQAAIAEVLQPGVVEFSTRAPLQVREGLTIAVGFPKGIIREPSRAQRVGWLLQSSWIVLVFIGGAVGIFLYYFLHWRSKGVDPAAGPVFPRYQPPEGFPPSALRYMREGSYDDRCMAADLVLLGTRGCLNIQREKKFLSDTWILERRSAPAEQEFAPLLRLWLGLFQSRPLLELDKKNNEILRKAKDGHTRAVQEIIRPRYIVDNRSIAGMGWGMSALLMIGSFITTVVTGSSSGIVIIAGSLGLVVVNIVFTYLLRRPTTEGRRLLDHIEGLRLYLRVASKEDLARLQLNAQEEPAMDPERFQAMLPYALALDVEDAWTERFILAMGSAAAAAAMAGTHWYHSSTGSGGLSSLGSDLGSSLSSKISSSSVPPGSSSGGGGGGFSGGGGGGGGGGGR